MENNQSIEEGNKLIAEFMGATKQEYNVLDVKEPQYCWRFPGDSFDDMIKNFETQTPYHSSWDWLIPVAFKIKCYIVPEQKTEKEQDELEIEAMKLWEGISYSAACINIEFLWHSIILFIQWHNQNNKNGKDN